MKFIVAIAIGLLVNSNLLAQMVDVAAIHHFSSGKLSLLLFENQGDYLSLANEPFTARTYEVDDPYPHLNVAGDFDGDGVDEIALFSDLLYKPNMNPDFTVFYNYFGTAPETRQSNFIFESDGTSFSLLPGDVYNGTKLLKISPGN
jgi:hypothetical protein